MESQVDDVKSARRNSGNCGICGLPLGSETIRCPLDGKMCHPQCSSKYFDERIESERNICKDCNARLEEEQEKRRSEDMMKTAKIVFAFVVILVIFLLVRRWI